MLGRQLHNTLVKAAAIASHLRLFFGHVTE
jgi:hypothetical protein